MIRIMLLHLMLVCIGLALFATGCEGQDYTTAHGVGDLEEDVSFITLEQACEQHPDYALCNEIGQSTQEWVSAEHYGWEQGGNTAGLANFQPTCYSHQNTSGGANTVCFFPWIKQINITFDESSCIGVGGSHSLLDIQKMLEGIRIGLTSWHGAGTGVTVTLNGSNAGKMPVLAVCETLAGTSLADSQLVSQDQQFMVGLPLFDGEDRDRSYVIKGGLIRFDINKMLNSYKFACDVATPSSAERKGFGIESSQHESGHIVGFNHFRANAQPMYPSSCSQGPRTTAWAIPQPMKDALSIYNSSPFGGVTIQDVNLDNLAPD